MNTPTPSHNYSGELYENVENKIGGKDKKSEKH